MTLKITSKKYVILQSLTFFLTQNFNIALYIIWVPTRNAAWKIKTDQSGRTWMKKKIEIKIYNYTIVIVLQKVHNTIYKSKSLNNNIIYIWVRFRWLLLLCSRDELILFFRHSRVREKRKNIFLKIIDFPNFVFLPSWIY